MISEMMIHGRFAGRSRRTRERGIGGSSRAANQRLHISACTERWPAPRAPVAPGETSRRARSKPIPAAGSIERDTPIVPCAIAEGVIAEAQTWLRQSLPRRWVRELVAKADMIYSRNERFRRRIRGAGDSGREYLWMFARHWLAALMRERRPALFAHLPSAYCVGGELPGSGFRASP